MRHGTLIAPVATVVQVDVDADALGSQRRLSFGVVGDVRQIAEAVAGIVPEQPGYRSSEVQVELVRGVRWRDSAFETVIEPGRIDPRELTIVLDRLLPEERIVAVDSGNFM